jgi:hypothetical protein
MKLKHEVTADERLLAILILVTSSDDDRSAARVAARGLLNRIDESYGFYDVGVRFRRFTFL